MNALLLASLLVAGSAAAGEMDAEAPARVATAAATIPEGPPRAIAVEPGADLGAALAGLPAGSRLGLRSGVHRGPLVIDRPVEVWGEPGAVISGGGAGSVVVVAAAGVTVRDLHVTGGGALPQHDDAGLVIGADRFRVERLVVDDVYLGIDVRLASDGIVRDCRVTGDPEAPFGFRGDGIRLWEAHRNEIVGNHLAHVRDLVIWYSDHNLVEGNVVSGSRYGTHLMHTAGNRIVGNRYVDDVVGVFTMYSREVSLLGNVVTGSLGAAGVGFGFKESDGIVVEDNELVANTTGLYLDTTPHRRDGTARFAGNLVGASEVGVRFHGPQSGAVFAANGFVGNVTPVAVDGGGDASGSAFVANRWTEYAGYDLDRDGVGDLPFELRSASGSSAIAVPSWGSSPAHPRRRCSTCSRAPFRCSRPGRS